MGRLWEAVFFQPSFTEVAGRTLSSESTGFRTHKQSYCFFYCDKNT